MSNFRKFTNLYSLTKTLRFELRPVGETEKMLKEKRIFETDGQIKKKYEATKPFFDRLHHEFVKKALKNVVIEGLDEYLKIYKKFVKDKKNKQLGKNLEQQEKFLRKQVGLFFDAQANKWIKKYLSIKFKKKDLDILFEVPQVFELLKEKYGKEDESFLQNDNGDFVLDEKGKRISIFDSWQNFGGYFKKFFETRKNFYKTDGTSTAIATRAIDQNLRRFCDNIFLFEKIKGKVNFEEVEREQNIFVSNIFDIKYYSNCLAQDGIDKYNQIIGGYTKNGGEKIKGLNEIINKYRQDNKGEKIPFFKKLDKQILSEKDKKFIDEIENDEELKNILEEFVKNAQKKIGLFDSLINDLIVNIDSYDLNKIYISKAALNTIVHKWTNQTEEFERLLYEAMKDDKPTGLKYEKKENKYKFPDFIALGYILNALENVNQETEFWKARYYKSENKEEGILELGESAAKQFLQIYKNELDRLHSKTMKDDKGRDKKVGLEYSLPALKELLQNFNTNESSRIVIKDFADDVLCYYQLAKYFSVEKKREWNFAKLELGDFYTNPDFGYEKFYENAYEKIVQIYNKIRNYLTKKPFSGEKWKLNFKNAALAGGWDKNKERDYKTIILRKGGQYYLGIMEKKCNDLFADKNKDKFIGGGYEKMVYKLFPGPNKMMPKVCFSKKGLEFFKPSKEILDIYKNEKFKQGDNFSLSAMHKLIDFYKEALKQYEGWKVYDFSHSKDTKDYRTNIGEFYNDVALAGYGISWQNISEEYIKEKNEAGELYLFEIHNKDWNLKDGQRKTGAKNLHTLYFGQLFSEENAKSDFIFKLNGKAELFFRPKTDEKKLGYRKDKQGREVVKNKRYAQDKMFLHLSIELNRGADNSFGFNKKINEFLVDNSDINVIGVDRGEKHLAYYSVVNQEGEILESKSLNKIGEVDYYAKLTRRAKEREGQRKDWQQVSDIKNLKKGYISQVVRKLADLAIEHNAIIVLEDLNMRFKQIRGGIERSIYQQLEKALIEKLNFLVNKKEIDPKKAGHLLRAYQLTAPFETFKDMGKQTGIIFYTQASYTSQIDPLTGWRPNLYLKKGNAKVNKEQILKFKKIKYNKEKDRFEFAYDLKDFGNQKDYPQKTEWTLCSNVERWRWDRKLNNNKGGYVEYPKRGENSITEKLKQLFAKYQIDINGNILEQIKSVDENDKSNAGLFRDLIFFWGLICQIRNTDGNLDEKIKHLEREGKNDEITEKEKFNSDFILSPVEPFFDSRRANDFGENLPQNGDANGAYNIARKGLLILQEKLSKWQEENEQLRAENKKEKFSPDLYISHIEWDNFATRTN